MCYFFRPKVRAVSRSATSEKALALATLPGVTVVEANMDDAASLDKAFEGAYGVFAVTNFWEHFQPVREATYGQKMCFAFCCACLHFVFYLKSTSAASSKDFCDTR